ncbi:MAG TPA: hypothetical protein VG937_13500 [Polyangiaceae bacterium]|jgi:hypothetical protein|nr:hypothetical protein [Polyangiaceae bacterium]
MAAVHSDTGEGLGSSGESIQVNKHEWSLGPIKPILRALGIGFAVGLVTMAVLAFVQ